MKRPDPATTRADFDRNAFLVLLVVLTVAFAWILWPYYGGVFWGAVLALLFEPMYRRLVVRFRGRRNLAALTTIAPGIVSGAGNNRTPLPSTAIVAADRAPYAFP